MGKVENNLRAELIDVGGQIEDEIERHHAAIKLLLEKKKKIIDKLNDEFVKVIIKK
jgi:hypothetical protein